MAEETDFGILMALGYQAMVTQLHAQLAKKGLTKLGSSYGVILRTIDMGELNQRALAERLGVTPQAVGKVVTEMVRKKLLIRRVDPRDARARVIAVGPRGAELLKYAREFHARFETELVEKLGGDVLATRRVLAHIVDRAGPNGARLRLA